MLESRITPAVRTWTGLGANDLWSNAANWDTGVPVDGDDVRISATANSAEVLFDTSVAGTGVAINSLTSDGTNPVGEPFKVTGDTLTLSGAGPFSFGNTLTLSISGVIDGTGDIAINGGLTWTNGTMSGSGTTTILAGTTAAFAPGDKFLGRTLVNQGTIDYSGAVIRFGASAGPVGVINNNGVFNFAGNGILNNVSFPSAGHAFNNAGTFNLLSNGLREISGVQFNSTGSVNVNVSGGRLGLNGGGSSSGDFTLAAGTSVDLQSTNYTLEAGASFLGAGFVRLPGGGTTTIAGAVDAANFFMQNAGLDGAGDLTVSTAFDWQAGRMIGSGQTILAPTATMTIPGGGDKNLGRTLINHGIINQSGTNFAFGFQGSVGVLNNDGVFNTTGVNSPIGAVSSPSTDHAFNNTGTFNRSGAGETAIAGIQFNNSGTVNVLGGTLTLNSALSNFSGTTLTGGAYNVAGTLKFTGANIETNAATIVLDGTAAQIVNQSNANALANFASNLASGSFTIQNVPNFTTAGAFSNAGLIAVAPTSTFTVGGSQSYGQSGGTTTLNGTLAATTSNFQGGLLQGSGTINGNVNNAAQIGPGASPGILTITGNYTQSDVGVLNVEVGGTALPDFDQLNITGAANLAGIVNVTRLGGFVPAGADLLRIVNAGSLTGAFDTVNGLFPGGRFAALYDATGAILDPNLVPIAGNDTDATLEDTAVTTNVLGNDSDPDGDAMNVVAVATSTQGATPVINGDGTIDYTPPPDFFGSDAYTYTLRDSVGNEATATVAITVTPVNDAPTLDVIPDRAILEDAATQTVNLTGITTGGGESQTLTVTATSSNPGVVPDPTVSYTSPNATGTLTFTPVANQSGTATITVTVTDSGGTANGGVHTVIRTFVVTVTAVNDIPILNSIANPAPMLEDAGTRTINLTGISPGGGETQTLTVTATSSNPSLIPDPVVTYTSPDSTGSLSFTPAPNQSGTATITVTVTDNGGTANGGINFIERTFTVTVTAVNDSPALDSIPGPVTILEDAGPQTVNLSGISAGLSESQTLTVTAVSSQPGLIPNPTVTYTSADATGSLSFTPVGNESGSAVITVTVTDNGGTANGGVNFIERTFTVTVSGVNDSPTLDSISDPTVILEDDGVQAVDLTGISTGVGETQTLTVSATSSNPGLIADPTVTYTSPNAAGSLTYTPVGNQSGTAVITVTVTDDGGTANGGVNTLSRTFTVTVAPLNDSLVTSVKPLPAVSAPSFTVAWSGTDSSGGSELAAFDIFVSTDGGASTPWLENTTATSGIFVGELGKHYRFFSVGIDHAGGRERRPLIADAETRTALFQRDLPSIAEDVKNPVGVPVSTLLGTAMSDADPGAIRGVAVTGVSGSGTWQFSADGKTWKPLTGASEDAAWLLTESFRVRFVPAANFVGSAGILFRGWDRTRGAAGTQAAIPVAEPASPFSADGGFAQVRVTPVNDRPVLPTSPVPRLLPTPRAPVVPAGQAVASLVRSAKDIDGNVLGVAVMGTSGTGVWQFSLDAGVTWTNVGVVSGIAALLLGPADLVRFTPTAGATGNATLTVKAWDQSSGIRGTRVNSSLAAATTFSTASVVASSRINGAPVLAGANPILTMAEDQSPNNGFAVSALLTGRFTDDAGALQGVAITGANDLGHGAWQYSTDGKTWRALGAVSDTEALLLRSSDKLRFLPNADFNGPNAATLSYKAWDQTFGAAGVLADVSAFYSGAFFSNASLSASINVTPVADRPVLDISVTTALDSFLPGGTPSSARVADLLENRVRAVDQPATGIAVTAVAGAGVWEFSLDAGNSWSAVGIVSALSGRFLDGDAWVRFVPNAAFRGVASIRYKVWDETIGSVGAISAIAATSTAFSKEIGTAAVAVNNAPILNAGTVTLPAIPEDSKNPAGFAVSGLLGTSFSDPDGQQVPRGIAVTALTGAVDGTWQFSTNGGTRWSPVGVVDDASALLLRSIDKLRFVPTENFHGTASVTFKAWDQTAGAFGGRGDASINGGSSAFSTGSRTGTITVTSINDRPSPRPSFPLGQIHLPSVAVGTASPAGVRVEDLVSAGIIDPDGDALGIAVFGLTGTTNGQWQFSTNGTTWQNIGTVSATSALLLSHSDFVRFVPNSGFIGSAAIKFRAWDQTRGVARTRIALTSTAIVGSLSLADFLAPVWVNTSPVLSAT